MQHHAADQLHVEMALAERALGRFAHDREGLVQKIVQGLRRPRAALAELLASAARSSSSVIASNWGSSALIASTRLNIGFSRRSFWEPKMRRAIPLSHDAVLALRPLKPS